MSRKYAESGKVDFHLLSDEELKAYLSLMQDMIYAYTGFSAEKVKVLEEVWGDLRAESIERLADSACKEVERSETPTTLIRKVPKLRRSPAKRKI